jgi:hypothetical protein
MHPSYSLNIAFNNNRDILAKKDFGKKLYQKVGEIKLYYSLNDVHDLFSLMNKKTPDISANKEFLQKGLAYIDDLMAKHADAYHLSSNIACRLHKICDNLGMPAPHWVPHAYSTEATRGRHRFTYLYDWSSVDASAFPPQFIESFLNFIESYLADNVGTLADNPALNEIIISPSRQAEICRENMLSLSKAKEKDKGEVNDAAVVVASTTISCPTVELSHHEEAVSHGEFVSRKYLSLMKSAAARNLPFTLGIEELSAILRNKRCHFTQERLVCFPHDVSKVKTGELLLPDNYLSIDRLDNTQGYTLGNMVVCGRAINTIKDQVSEQDFNNLLLAKKAMTQSGVDPKQLAMLLNMGSNS